MKLITLLALLSSPLLLGSGDGATRVEPRPDEHVAAGHPTRFVGRVLTPRGLPARGALVETSAGGEAVTGTDGSFALEVHVPTGAESVEVTAALDVRGQSLAASILVVPPSSSPTTDVGSLLLAPGVGCRARWQPTFSPPGVDAPLSAVTVFDDGSGPALYAAGERRSSGSPTLHIPIEKWDGSRWSSVGSVTLPFNSNELSVNALMTFDDGSGPALYVAGDFTTAGGVPANRIARWDGSTWSGLGSGMNFRVHAMAAFDDGSGPALYAAGWFTNAGGVATNKIAKWNGSSWSRLGTGLTGFPSPTVHALAVFDDGSGPALYAGGDFDNAGLMPVNGIARWDGWSWTGLDGGVNGQVLSLAAYEDGGGSALYAGGAFTTAGGVAAYCIGKWDGSSWLEPGGGVNGPVHCFTVYDPGSGPVLVAGGFLSTAGEEVSWRIASWDGSSWSALGTGMDDPSSSTAALTVWDDGSGPVLVAGGSFTTAGGVWANHIARWDGSSWSAFGGERALDGDNCRALAVFDDGGGPALYAAGRLQSAGGLAVNNIARFDGSSWSALAGGVTLLNEGQAIETMTVFDDGGGPALFVGGGITTAGGQAVSIARWDGSSWSALGSGTAGRVKAFTEFDDGSGSALYVGGAFATAGGVIVNSIAKWDGSSWAALGSGLEYYDGFGEVEALTVYDDGSGSALYVGGSFTTAGGTAASGIARWDGSSWSALGSGIEDVVRALTVFDDGSGPALYAGGRFTSAGGVSANNIAGWDGSSWSALGSGMFGGEVVAFSAVETGQGPVLCAAGNFSSAGGVAAHGIAKWNGSSWSALGSGIQGAYGGVSVASLAVFDDGDGPALYAGGPFASPPALHHKLAKWACGRKARPLGPREW